MQVVIFAVPGAFTPTCSLKHLPGFIEKADELKAKGVETIACVAVNDAFVMDAWGKSVDVGDKVMLLADGSALFTKVCSPGRAPHALLQAPGQVSSLSQLAAREDMMPRPRTSAREHGSACAFSDMLRQSSSPQDQHVLPLGGLQVMVPTSAGLYSGVHAACPAAALGE